MSCLVGVCGFTGAGKSTALELLQQATGGQYIYLGQAIFDELDRRGVEPTPENQSQVRMELRRADGAALARMNVDRIKNCLELGKTALVDAVMSPAEYDCLKSSVTWPVHLLYVDASFKIRAERLERRPGRSMTPQQVEKRDRIEVESLQIDRVFRSTTGHILNEGSIEQFAQSLASFLHRAGIRSS
ncbi:AAA family ATPase [Rhizobium sp. 268]|uniref:AAA family ATPase n=1 Tax=Rhizobium sp. 268 TaxID=2996375 RepID=UPI002F93C043